jgi:SAM-dependent methyltransferase
MKPFVEAKRTMPQRGRRWLVARLRRYGFGRAAAPTADVWNSEYEAGRWSSLESLEELSRFSVLVGYAAHLKPGGALLDIGCGEGTLWARSAPYGFAKYVGVDISASAIAKATHRFPHDARFISANAEHYLPDDRYDVVVFNEVIYYFDDPLRTVDRYACALKSDGIILLSACTAFAVGVPILKQLKRAYRTIDETRVTHHASPYSWICTVLDGGRHAP